MLIGDEFLCSQKIEEIVADFQKKLSSEVFPQSFDLSETALEDVLVLARTATFLSNGQIFLLKNSSNLKSQNLELLENYLKSPSDKTLLIFEADSVEAVKSLEKLVKSAGEVITFDKKDVQSIASAFIQRKLKKIGKTMSPNARGKIIAMCGEAVSFLDSMLERLIRFSGDFTQIDEEMVAKFEEDWAEIDVFKLGNAIIARDSNLAVKCFNILSNAGEAEPLAVIPRLHWQIRQLWQVAILSNKGVSDKEICSKLRIPPFRLAQMKKISLKRAEAMLEDLYQLDIKLKTGRAGENKEAALEKWILEYSK